MVKDASLTIVYLGLCLHIWLNLSINGFSMPTEPGLKEMRGVVETIPEHNRLEQDNKQDNTISFAVEDSKIRPIPRAAEALSTNTTRNDLGTFEERSDAKNMDIETGSGAGFPNKRYFTQEGKRRIRFVKSASRQRVNADNFNNAHKRRMSLREKRSMSINGPLLILTDMIVEHEQRRLAKEREDMRRRLLEVGKRSEDVARMDDADLYHLVQTVLKSK